ncbi:MAG: hypothetical protein JWM25_126 [Thermoleophilia bacterium]|nr:hypothetical protein [Thermoleophilia bacterium]
MALPSGIDRIAGSRATRGPAGVRARGSADGLDAELRRQLLRTASTGNDRSWPRTADIADARNAHRTNTLAELRSALASSATWLEGDLRLRDGRPVLAHGAHDGWSLSLRDWLEIGAASGRGLKLDFKQAAAVEPTLRMLRDAKVPDERLIINVATSARSGGARVRLDQLQSIRARFPKAILNLDPGPAPYDPVMLNAVVRLARSVGGPVMFPLDLAHVTPAVVRALRAAGRVAVWNDPRRTPPGDVAETTRRLRRWGVDGMVDLRG